jgi:tRNA pseudouridine13 synthase
VARFVPSPQTFVVEEIPAYRPGGSGEHCFVWIEKRDLTTVEAARRLARALGVEARDVGHAGLKDRHATTRQFLSLPGVEPERALAFADGEGNLRVLEAARHGNKLRMGHLHGNRFEVVVEELAEGEGDLIEQRLRLLAETGLPNRYGEQRFGAAGDNVARALAVVRGELRERDRRRRFFLLSALQSAVFNRLLELRQERGGLLAVLAGDVLQKRASGGLFVCEDPAVDQPRVLARELVPTGPLPGNREREPPEGTPARALEDEALAAVGVGRHELAALGRDLPGARRPLVVHLDLAEPAVVAEGSGRLRLRFSLPAGSYATVVMQALGVTGAAGRPPAEPETEVTAGPTAE